MAATRQKRPTVKQKRAMANLVENGGNVYRAMVDAGYSPATAKNPNKLTDSVTFRSIAEQIPDDLLVQVHMEGLAANRVISANITYGDADEKTNDFIEVPDHAVRHKFLDSAYKIKKIMDGDGTKVAMVLMFDPIFNAPTPETKGGRSQ